MTEFSKLLQWQLKEIVHPNFWHFDACFSFFVYTISLWGLKKLLDLTDFHYMKNMFHRENLKVLQVLNNIRHLMCRWTIPLNKEVTLSKQNCCGVLECKYILKGVGGEERLRFSSSKRAMKILSVPVCWQCGMRETWKVCLSFPQSHPHLPVISITAVSML